MGESHLDFHAGSLLETDLRSKTYRAVSSAELEREIAFSCSCDRSFSSHQALQSRDGPSEMSQVGLGYAFVSLHLPVLRRGYSQGVGVVLGEAAPLAEGCSQGGTEL